MFEKNFKKILLDASAESRVREKIIWILNPRIFVYLGGKTEHSRMREL